MLPAAIVAIVGAGLQLKPLDGHLLHAMGLVMAASQAGRHQQVGRLAAQQVGAEREAVSNHFSMACRPLARGQQQVSGENELCRT